MKSTKIIYWISTTLIFLFEGVMPALFSQSEEGKKGISDLGYPAYFGIALAVFKVLGAIILMVPKFPRLKEWAYAGFFFDFVFAAISHYVVTGPDFLAVFPIIVLAVLMVSYVTYHKLNGNVLK
ncbi:DoxX family protein [Ferruginibacter sp. HRS2-29]|uniref:DoxX family protein n=1 Tax=Ferruginibacter sp. HRS2-29 TaxID=2487334 RepID=UPI0020CD7441|nr:DoxX family protein [Ferruginibacter sp. HRS2-29]MCP9750932.1 DoxX family protein [Ferruginibacter sp. HRS2-29]